MKKKMIIKYNQVSAIIMVMLILMFMQSMGSALTNSNIIDINMTNSNSNPNAAISNSDSEVINSNGNGDNSNAGKIKALWVFGDSLSDAGNNNNFASLAKANHHPYGINFPGSIATGRFIDGYNAMDYLAFKLGLPLVPIYEDPMTKGVNLLKGVNFASGASGIMPYTGVLFGKVITLDMQIKLFAQVVEEVEGLLGKEETKKLLDQSIFGIITASNDWLNTYFFPGSPLPIQYSTSEFRDVLISHFSSQIQTLYSLGATKFAIGGLGAIGCCPSQLRAYKSENGTCIHHLNDVAQDYNNHLQSQLSILEDSLPNSTFAFLNLFKPLLDATNNPSSFGFTTGSQACCGIGKYGGFLNCFKGFPVCDDVSNHLFFDAYHPSSKFIKQVIDIMWNNGPPYCYPRSGQEIVASF